MAGELVSSQNLFSICVVPRQVCETCREFKTLTICPDLICFSFHTRIKQYYYTIPQFNSISTLSPSFPNRTNTYLLSPQHFSPKMCPAFLSIHFNRSDYTPSDTRGNTCITFRCIRQCFAVPHADDFQMRCEVRRVVVVLNRWTL